LGLRRSKAHSVHTGGVARRAAGHTPGHIRSRCPRLGSALAASHSGRTVDLWKLVRYADRFLVWNCEFPSFHHTYRDGEHADDCKILKADPGVEIQWSEIETGYWVAECVYGKEYYRDPVADRRVGSTRSIRRPVTTRGVRVRLRDRSIGVASLAEGQARDGRKLQLGRVRRLRHGLAGSALRREHRVTTDPRFCAAGHQVAGWPARARGPRPAEETRC
jgi:hypothetical protein